jgi:hypothetical protein
MAKAVMQPVSTPSVGRDRRVGGPTGVLANVGPVDRYRAKTSPVTFSTRAFPSRLATVQMKECRRCSRRSRTLWRSVRSVLSSAIRMVYHQPDTLPVNVIRVPWVQAPPERRATSATSVAESA